MPKRCAWVPADQPLYLAYHDEEWGVPVHDDTHLFEMLTLEGAQAGLSWSTILNKREGYRRAFAGFVPTKVARFTPAKVERLLQDPGIVRNRLKVESTVNNASGRSRFSASTARSTSTSGRTWVAGHWSAGSRGSATSRPRPPSLRR